MRSWQSPSYVLDPGGTFVANPGGCWHCAHNPRYAHRHWRQAEPAAPGPPAEWQPNWAWRLAFRVYGDG